MEAQRRYVEHNYELIKGNSRREYTRKSAIWKWKINELKSLAINMKGGVCVRCNLALCDDNPSFCFDFHHRDPSLTKDSPGKLLARAARVVDNEKRKIEFFEEIKDCDVLCAICHRKIHHEMGAISDGI
jgi:hypothetical protein